MPTPGLSVLAAVTVAAVVACWLALGERYRQQIVFDERGNGRVFPGLEDRIDSIAHVVVTRADGQFVLSRRADGWANMGIGGYPATAARVETVLGRVAGLEYVEPRTGRSRLHHRLEVEDVAAGAKSTRLTFKDSSGSTLADVIVGRRKEAGVGPDRQGVYIRLPGDERAWLAAGALDVRHAAVEWSERAVVDIDVRSLSSLSIRHADGETVTLHRDRPRDPKMTLKGLPAGARIEHQFQIDYMAQLLQAVRFDDARRADVTDTGTPPVFEIVAQANDQLVVTLRAGQPEEDGSVWTRIAADVADDAQASEDARREAARIDAGFDGWSVKLPPGFAARLAIRPSDIVHGGVDGGADNGGDTTTR